MTSACAVAKAVHKPHVLYDSISQTELLQGSRIGTLRLLGPRTREDGVD